MGFAKAVLDVSSCHGTSHLKKTLSFDLYSRKASLKKNIPETSRFTISWYIQGNTGGLSRRPTLAEELRISAEAYLEAGDL